MKIVPDTKLPELLWVVIEVTGLTPVTTPPPLIDWETKLVSVQEASPTKYTCIPLVAGVLVVPKGISMKPLPGWLLLFLAVP